MNIFEKITRFVERVFKTSLEIFLDALKLGFTPIYLNSEMSIHPTSTIMKKFRNTRQSAKQRSQVISLPCVVITETKSMS